MNQTPERKLAAIMFTDIVGYTDLMGKNESDSIRYFYGFIGAKFEEIAFIYWLMDEKDKAYKESQKALKVYVGLPDLDEDSLYHAALSWVYALLDKPQKAIQEAKMAMELYPLTKILFRPG